MGDSSDQSFMHRALTLARRAWGETCPNPMVGAVIVRNGEILGEGWHHCCGKPHAEAEALADAGRRGCDVAGATIYVTLEPCSTYGHMPPCSDAIIRAKLARVVIGTLDPNPAHAGRAVELLRDAGIHVEVGVEEEACKALNRAFFCWITTNKPYVILKMAMTLDGKIATASGESQWITGPSARARVQELRQLADAILVGGETVRQDRPELIVRDPAEWKVQPRRLVATRMPQALLDTYFDGGNPPEKVEFNDTFGWDDLLRKLGREKVMTLLIEGGGDLAGHALRAGAVDRVEFHIAPKILGGAHSRPVVGGVDPAHLTEALALTDVEIKRYGDDIALAGNCGKKERKTCLPD